MRKKQFKAESKKLLDMMINSIYTHKEIFLRELISNASDAVDKLYFRSLTDDSVTLSKEDFCIRITPDKENRTLTISDNGIGMTAEELENNLGVIAKSGSKEFKTENESDEVEIIGQFGVGFYSAFMVAKNVKVISRAFGSKEANCWESGGVDGYTVYSCEKAQPGTDIILYINDNTDECSYDEYLEEYSLRSLVKKYSNYIRYPIRMLTTTSKPVEGKEGEYEDVTEDSILNSMLPLWKKNKNEITEEEYNSFYKEVFYDYENPLKVIHTKTEGQATFNALMYVPSHAPFDYYSKEYEKGLQLYSKGVLITDKCSDLLPDYFNFVRGLVDSEDLSLNISREMLQHDHQLKLIAKTIEKKIKSELKRMLENEREEYEKFFGAFGTSLKFGVYSDYGIHKDDLEDLLIFKSSREKKYVSLAEYVENMKDEQKGIYYASGESVEKIDMLPQTDFAKDKDIEFLYLTDYVDEFAIRTLMSYSDKPFINICSDEAELDSKEEKDALTKQNEDCAGMLDAMKAKLGDKVKAVRFTNKLKTHPVCLSNDGMLSAEMEKVLNSMPGNSGVKAELVLEINASHAIAGKLNELFETDKEKLEKYAVLLYEQARLIGSMPVDDPVEFSNLICELM